MANLEYTSYAARIFDMKRQAPTPSMVEKEKKKWNLLKNRPGRFLKRDNIDKRQVDYTE